MKIDTLLAGGHLLTLKTLSEGSSTISNLSTIKHDLTLLKDFINISKAKILIDRSQVVGWWAPAGATWRCFGGE